MGADEAVLAPASTIVCWNDFRKCDSGVMPGRNQSRFRGEQVAMRSGDPMTNVARDVPHLLPGEARSLEAIVERLVAAYRPQRVYLFGSKARNDGGPDSDFDLLVVVPDTVPDEQTGSRLVYKVLRGTGTATDIVVWTRSGFESRLPAAASLPATVVREGLLLYAT
jgi:uncharacterized protein